MIDLINELPEDGLKSSPETSRFTENKLISRKNRNSEVFQRIFYKRKIFRWKAINHLLNKEIYTSRYLENFPMEDCPLPPEDCSRSKP